MVFQDGVTSGVPRVDSIVSERLTPDALAGMLAMLRQAVVFPWESVDQIVREHGSTDLGDPQTPGTAAWHFRHIIEIFRQHARVVMLALNEKASRVDGAIASLDGVVWTGSDAARDLLLADVDAFIKWAAELPEVALNRPFAYGKETNLAKMIACMSMHITWHAAAVHYWCKWKRPPQPK
jgi:hypothetical protein